MPPLLTTVKEHLSPIWKSATLHWAAAISVTALLLVGFSIRGGAAWYARHHDAIAPFLTLTAGLAVAGVALVRHFAQTNADRERRVTESFSKAVEQLGSDRTEVRLGGIYTLERILRENPDDYWTVMETLCAFVRERTRSETTGSSSSPSTDIAAVLAVIVRRNRKNLQRESCHGWRFDFHEANLWGASLQDANLSGANFVRTRLNKADLNRADLSGANLSGAKLWDADLSGANLSGANLSKAVLVDADLSGAKLGGAIVSEEQLAAATGDARTQLPDEMLRPAHWPPAKP